MFDVFEKENVGFVCVGKCGGVGFVWRVGGVFDEYYF